MLKDDNEQLAQQFERERQLRRSADQQLLENEDANEQMSREIQNKTELLESETRHLELKCKNFKDQSKSPFTNRFESFKIENLVKG